MSLVWVFAAFVLAVFLASHIGMAISLRRIADTLEKKKKRRK